MKKLLFSICLFVAFANNAKAQTKAETISWLQEKLQKYCRGYGDNIVVKVTECSITFSYTLSPETNLAKKTYHNQYHIFPTDGLIFNVGIWGETKEEFISMEIKGKLQRIRIKNYSEVESLNGHSEIHIVLGEENLRDRLNKAVTHLAKFCPKKQETF